MIRKSAEKGYGFYRSKIFWIGVAAFSLTLSAFVTSTFAWFAVSDHLGAKDISITYGTDDFAVQLLTGSSYTKGVDLSKAVSSDEGFSFSESDFSSLDPVSSMYSGNEYYEKTASDGSTSEELFPVENAWLNNDDGVHKITNVPEFKGSYRQGSSTHESYVAGDGYIQFGLHFSANQTTYLYLDSTTSCLADTQENKYIAANLGLSYTPEELLAVQNAVRISFYSPAGYLIYEPNVSKSSKTSFAGPLDAGGGDGCYDYVDGKETLYGEYNYKDATIAYGGTDTYVNPFVANHQSGVEQVNVSSSEQNGGLKRAYEKTYTLEELTNDTGYLAEGHPYLLEIEPTSSSPSSNILAESPDDNWLIVSVYLEGWDKDTTDLIGAMMFNLSLVFTGLVINI